MTEVSSPKRQFARDVSNIKQSDLQTPTKPQGSNPEPSVVLQVPASPCSTGCWTSADQFKFVEEDDDEVLFRVRESGVLRSLALPNLTNAAISTEETLEEKQVNVLLPLASNSYMDIRNATIHSQSSYEMQRFNEN
jgi:hypothetical protein